MAGRSAGRGQTGTVLLPSLLAAPLGCTALIVGVAAASDPRLRGPATPSLLSPALIVAGGALALGPAVDSWFSGLSGPWSVLQILAVIVLLAVLVQDGRRAGYGAPPPPRPGGRGQRP